MSPIAEYYENARRRSDELVEQLRQAREVGAPPDEIKRLEKLLEDSYYVGD